MSYAEGFEDAIELAIHELEKMRSLDELRRQLDYILVTVKERKFDRLKIMLESR